jgi:hypothetical protein
MLRVQGCECNGDISPTVLDQLHSMTMPHLTGRISIIAAILTIGYLGALFGQSSRKTTPSPMFTQLSGEDSIRLEQQRAVVTAAAKQRYGTAGLTRTKSDLPVLQRLIDDRVFNKSQTYELQSLGVAFGDVLASELPLRWVIVTDEYGTDPTLRFTDTSFQVNALTMISKRVEGDETVNVAELLRLTREQLTDYQRTLVDSRGPAVQRSARVLFGQAFNPISAHGWSVIGQ